MVAAIVAAAGLGTRFGASRNKVLLPLAGRPILLRSVETLFRVPEVCAVIVVAASGDLDEVRRLLADRYDGISVVEGGRERGDSVRAGLAATPATCDFVAVHDGARPLATPSLIAGVIAMARRHGAAAPALPVFDTLKSSPDGQFITGNVSRDGLFTVQTPQVFQTQLLRRAYAEAAACGFSGTDDAAYVERLGHPVALAPGDRRNLKITRPEDLELAERLLGRETRTGIGYDVHRLVPGRPLVLGGVALDHPQGLGLDGHSDADVLVHAIMDAVLGAAAVGDIGRHFPNTDARYRGADSLALAREVNRIVASAGWTVANVDAMLIAEQPRIAPHVDEMRRRIGAVLEVDFSAVSIKATTNEGLGFLGRGEGIAAQAVATLERRPR